MWKNIKCGALIMSIQMLGLAKPACRSLEYSFDSDGMKDLRRREKGTLENVLDRGFVHAMGKR